MKWSIEQRALLSDRDDTDAGQIPLVLLEANTLCMQDISP